MRFNTMIDEVVYNQFFNGLITGNRTKCSGIISELLNNNVSVYELYEEVIKKSLYQVGEMWEYGKISVATEHLASSLAESLLNEVYYKVISPRGCNKKVVVSCVENEFHQIGIKMVADVFEMNGWETHFLGANTPALELISFIKSLKPDLLAISLSIYFNLPMLESFLKAINKELPNLKILVGGQAFRHGGLDVIKKYANVVYTSDLRSIEMLIKVF